MHYTPPMAWILPDAWLIGAMGFVGLNSLTSSVVLVSRELIKAIVDRLGHRAFEGLWPSLGPLIILQGSCKFAGLCSGHFSELLHGPLNPLLLDPPFGR